MLGGSIDLSMWNLWVLRNGWSCSFTHTVRKHLRVAAEKAMHEANFFLQQDPEVVPVPMGTVRIEV